MATVNILKYSERYRVDYYVDDSLHARCTQGHREFPI